MVVDAQLPTGTIEAFPRKEFQTFDDQLVDRFLMWCGLREDTTGASFELFEERNGCKMWKCKPEGSEYDMFRGEAIIDASPQLVEDMISVPENIKLVDPTCKSVEAVHTFDKDHSVVHAKFAFPPLIKDRDFVYFALNARTKEGFVTVGKSCLWAEVPESLCFQRAEIGACGYAVVPIEGEPDKCRVIYLTQVNPKGWLPSWVVNQVAKTQAYYPGLIKEKTQQFIKLHAQMVAEREAKAKANEQAKEQQEEE